MCEDANILERYAYNDAQNMRAIAIEMSPCQWNIHL
jgi:hypothetical protein